MSEHVNVKFFL